MPLQNHSKTSTACDKMSKKEEATNVFVPVDRRQIQSLNRFDVQSQSTSSQPQVHFRKQTPTKSIRLSRSPVERFSLRKELLEMTPQRLLEIFKTHSSEFKKIQEIVLFLRPLPAFIIFCAINLGFYFYRSFNIPFYCKVSLLVMFSIIGKLIFPSVFPIVDEILLSSEIKHPPKDASNRLRTPEEATIFIFTLFNPIRTIAKGFLKLIDDNSISGLKLTLGIYLILFFFTSVFDLFWPVVILSNLFLFGPGIYFSPLIRESIVCFKKRWNIY